MRIASLAAILLAASTALFGQTRLLANIPFEFGVSDRVLPAGEYLFMPNSLGLRTAWISAVNGKTALYFAASPGVVAQSGSLPPQILFRKVRQQILPRRNRLGRRHAECSQEPVRTRVRHCEMERRQGHACHSDHHRTRSIAERPAPHLLLSASSRARICSPM